ncbi:MAG: hypothetical protein O7I93_08460 [Gemmatimonadetes bacterium]|nr:hypothetical protein [Gemmatimonadota bacterium]
MLRLFVRRELMDVETVQGMLAWPHSGFHVHDGSGSRLRNVRAMEARKLREREEERRRRAIVARRDSIIGRF